MNWLKARGQVGGSVLLDHGEPVALEALRARLADGGWRTAVPAMDDAFVLTKTSAERLVGGRPRLAPGQAARLDWHNDRADFLVRLNEVLQAQPDDGARTALLQRLCRLL